MRESQKVVMVFAVVLVIVLAVAIVFSRGPGSTVDKTPKPEFSVYSFTRNGNHTQLEVSYSVGSSSGLSQVEWLSFDNKTSLGSYVHETDDDCASTVIDNNPVEFRIRVDCNTMGIFVLTPIGNHTQYQTSYIDGATSGQVPIEWLNFDNKTALRENVAQNFSPECGRSVVENTSTEFQIQIANIDSGLAPCAGAGPST